MKNTLAAYQAIHKADDYAKQLARFIQRTRDLAESFAPKTISYTGWFVLLRKADTPSGFEFVEIFNPDLAGDKWPDPEWDYAMPIPTPDSISEFMGW